MFTSQLTIHHSAFRIHNSPFTTHYSAFTTRRSRRSERAQALVEYALIFPLQLMMTLAIIQLAHSFVAKQVLDYAAFCGARAAVVGLSYEDSLRAAAVPISRIAGPSGVIEPDDIVIPGWGLLRRSGAAIEKTVGPYGRFEIEETDLDGEPALRCNLTHAVELQVPIGNVVAYRIADVFLAADDLEQIGGAPHLRMDATCTLAQPWRE